MQLKRPLVILDLETTGTWIEKDRIIEIGMIRLEPGGARKTYEKRINPGIKIPAIVTEVTGISDADVKDAPFFRLVASDIVAFCQGADFAGFNLERFDLPLLCREMQDAGVTAFDLKGREIYDAQKIYHLHEKRDLTAAYKYYCDKELVDAHSALADSEATLQVLEAQLRKYGNGNQEITALAGFEYKRRDEFYDSERKIRWWNGELYMMFGKYARKESIREIARKDRGYLEWILSADFSDEVKDLIEAVLDGKHPAPPDAQPAAKGG